MMWGVACVILVALFLPWFTCAGCFESLCGCSFLSVCERLCKPQSVHMGLFECVCTLSGCIFPTLSLALSLNRLPSLSLPPSLCFAPSFCNNLFVWCSPWSLSLSLWICPSYLLPLSLFHSCSFSISLFLSLCIGFHLSLSLSLPPSLYLSLSLSIFPKPLSLPLLLNIPLPVFLSRLLALSLSLCISASLSPKTTLSLFLSVSFFSVSLTPLVLCLSMCIFQTLCRWLHVSLSPSRVYACLCLSLSLPLSLSRCLSLPSLTLYRPPFNFTSSAYHSVYLSVPLSRSLHLSDSLSHRFLSLCFSVIQSLSISISLSPCVCVGAPACQSCSVVCVSPRLLSLVCLSYPRFSVFCLRLARYKLANRSYTKLLSTTVRLL